MIEYIGLENHELFDFGKKAIAMRFYVRYMLDRTQSMFEYKNLPETIPHDMLELMLQSFGVVGIAEVNGDLYAFRGGLGGEPDVYYRPTIFTVANPALKLSREFVIDKDVALIKNDTTLTGLIPMYRKYASLIVEDDISQRMAVINKRTQKMIAAADDRTKESAEIYLDKLLNGNLAVVADNAFLDSLNVYDMENDNHGLTELIEMRNYHVASWFNAIGIDANLNMKREAINSAEAQLNDMSLLPLIDNMLYCRKEGVKKVNDMFGTEIEVEIAGAWEKEVTQINEEIEAINDEESEESTEEIGESAEETEEPAQEIVEIVMEEIAEAIEEAAEEPEEEKEMEDESE